MFIPPYSLKKKRITVEDLLVWAYRDELVHAARPEGMPVELGVSHRPGLAVSNQSERIQSGVKTDFEAPTDAYRVHAAVLSLGKTSVVLPSRTGTRAVRDVPCDVISDDAGWLAVEEREETVDLAQLVFQHAVAASRPEWFPVPILGFRHRQSHRLESACVHHPRSKRPWYCIVEAEGDLPHEVERSRALHTLWIESLAGVRDRLCGLDRFEVTEFLPSMRPWLAKSP